MVECNEGGDDDVINAGKVMMLLLHLKKSQIQKNVIVMMMLLKMWKRLFQKMIWMMMMAY